MSESQRFGLYYPYLHFSDSWLKIAALYWPRMGRIVPPGLNLNDSRVVLALSDELNFIVDVDPASAAEELTSTLIQMLETHCDELRNKYAIPGNSFVTSNSCGPSWPNPQRMANDWRNRSPSELEGTATVVALHAGKGQDRLWRMLVDAGLAIPSGDWFGLHPELAWLYMCALADKLARRNALTPTTDQFIAHAESLAWTDKLFADTLLAHKPGTVAAPQGGRREEVGLLALRLVIPKNLEDVPIEKIIRLRHRYATDFDAFYDEVADLARSLDGELAEITDQGVLAAYVDNETQRRFRQPLTDLQSAMYSLGVDTTITALTTKFELPTSAAIIGGELTHHPIIATGGALAFGTAALLRSFRQRRRQVGPSAASYLWRVEQTLNPDWFLGKVLNYMY